MSEEPIVVRDYDSLVAAFRARKDELGLSNNLCDHLLNRQAGYTDHYLGRADKSLGPVSITVFCELFAVEFIPRSNDKALTRMQGQYEQRADSQVRGNAKPLSIWQIMGRAGGLKRANNADKQRLSHVSKRAAKSRWVRPWERAGVSRATWFRRKKSRKMREQNSALHQA